MSALVGTMFLLLVFSVIPYTIAVVMPNWRWLLGLTVIAALPFSTSAWRWMISDVGPCGGFGIVMVVVGGAGLATGVVVCGLTLLLRWRGLAQRRVHIIRVAGAMIAPVVILLAPEIIALSGLWSR